jgi:hypothetical protein
MYTSMNYAWSATYAVVIEKEQYTEWKEPRKLSLHGGSHL